MEEKARNTQLKAFEVREGFIYYSKNGIIKTEQAPRYGSVKLEFVDGKPNMVKVKTQKKV